MLALATLIANYPIIVAVILTIYITKFIVVMRMYQDDYWVMEAAVIEDPKAWFAWHMRGMKRWEAQSYREALINWVMAKLISPKEFKLLFNISVVLRLLKKEQEAKEYFALALQNMIPGQEEELKPIIDDYNKGKLRLLT
uniref:Tetratricopeptide repeat protein n=1 Tax=viral metagenome TaxID=1070528 RepID=A0A6M3KEX9_9ZZZZ